MRKNLAFKILDAILISSKKKIKISLLKEFFKDLDFDQLINEANKRYEDFGFFVHRNDDHLELVTKPELAKYLISFFKNEEEENEIIQEFLEVLAIIAYGGPISLTDINQIRKKDSNSIVEELIKDGLIKKSFDLYKVTNRFLDYFGFKQLKELPDYYRLRKELRRKT